MSSLLRRDPPPAPTASGLRASPDPSAQIRRRLAHLLAVGAVRAATARSEPPGEVTPSPTPTQTPRGGPNEL